MRGLIGGVASGAVVAALGLGVISVVAPLPEAPGAGLSAALAAARAPAADAASEAAPGGVAGPGAGAGTGLPPAGSEFARQPADTQPLRPAPPQAPVLPQPGPASLAPAAPPEAPGAAPVLADTQPPARPDPVQVVPMPQPVSEPASGGPSGGPPDPASDPGAGGLALAPQPEDPVPVPPPGEVVSPVLEPAELPQGTDPNQMPIALGDGAMMLMPDGTILPREAALGGKTGQAPAAEAAAGAAPEPTARDTLLPSEAPLELPAETSKPRVFAAGEARTGGFGQKPAPLGPVAGAMPGQSAPPDAAAPDTAPDAAPDLAPDLAPEAPPKAPFGGASEAAGGAVQTNRLPQVGAAAPGAAGAPGAAADLALRRFAQPFTAPEGALLFSVVLIDPGVAAGGLDRATIKALGLPLTIAIDPARPDAAEAAADYRAAGFEVAILASDVPEGATPADLAVMVEAWLRILPEAVGVVDGPGASFRQTRALVQPVVEILAREGLGLFVMEAGLNAAEQLARSEGAGYAGIWREIDAARERGVVIERMLSRAAFEAQKNGSVSVLLSGWPESVAGLQGWAPVAGRSVVLAPVSALALRRLEGAQTP